jgi:hypothetical protein
MRLEIAAGCIFQYIQRVVKATHTNSNSTASSLITILCIRIRTSALCSQSARKRWNYWREQCWTIPARWCVKPFSLRKTQMRRLRVVVRLPFRLRISWSDFTFLAYANSSIKQQYSETNQPHHNHYLSSMNSIVLFFDIFEFLLLIFWKVRTKLRTTRWEKRRVV